MRSRIFGGGKNQRITNIFFYVLGLKLNETDQGSALAHSVIE